MPEYVVENINLLMEKVKGKIVTLFGLTYKGNVDDIRESPAIEVMDLLKLQGRYEIRAYDPHVNSSIVMDTMEVAVHKSDLVVVLTDHNEFKMVDTDALKNMRNKRVFDTRNIMHVEDRDIDYINFGSLYHYTKQEISIEDIYIQKLKRAIS
jgi:UDP-N-acetyl-D-mannosaminuronic acid dehydrogenase